MSMEKKCGIAIMAAVALLLTEGTGVAESSPHIWSASNQADWNNSQNWNLGTVPGSGGVSELAEIGSAGVGTAVISSDVPDIERWSIVGGAVPGSLEIRAGGSLTTVGEPPNLIGINSHGNLRMSGGVLSMASHFDVGYGEVIQTGGTIELTDEIDGFVSLLGGLFPGESASWQISGGATLNVATGMTVGLLGDAEFIQRGGQVHLGKSLVVGVTGGRGSVTFELTADLNVGTSIQIGGDGQMHINGGLATINTAGFIMAPGAELQMTVLESLSPIQTDWAKVDGNLDLRFGFALVFPPVAGDRLSLIVSGGDAPVEGAFVGKGQGSMFDANGIRMQITYQANVDGGVVANDVVVTILPDVLRAGDFDFNGQTDRGDVVILSRWFGKTSGAIWTDGDINGDGMVSLLDLAGLRRQFLADGSASPAASHSVPEPSGMMLIVLAMLTRMGRRRFSR